MRLRTALLRWPYEQSQLQPIAKMTAPGIERLAREAQAICNAPAVGVHRVAADVQPLGDFQRGFAVGQQRADFPFAGSQQQNLRWRLANKHCDTGRRQRGEVDPGAETAAAWNYEIVLLHRLAGGDASENGLQSFGLALVKRFPRAATEHLLRRVTGWAVREPENPKVPITHD